MNAAKKKHSIGDFISKNVMLCILLEAVSNYV